MNSEFEELEKGVILRWSDVSVVHKSRNGIYQKNGKLISLLTDFGRISKCYPDSAADDGNTLFYTGSGRRGNQKLDVHNQAMIDAIRTGREVPLFCKLNVNRWEYMGYWRVSDAEYVYEEKNERMVWRFVLKNRSA